MAMDLNRFAVTRGYLYHTTSMRNLERIRATGRLESAEAIMLASSERDSHSLRVPRRGARQVTVGGLAVQLRDQDPLYAGNIRFLQGLDFAAFCQQLNRLVFFWPGTETGPISYGVRHAQRYADEELAFIRVPTAGLFAANPDPGPLFCRYNSGSPRCTKGKGSPRGPATFQHASAFDGAPSSVVEVVLQSIAKLPASTEWNRSLGGGYELLRT